MKRSHFWVQDRKFGGKELDRVSGLNLMDFEARIYDPTTGRFYTPDPLSHINYWLSPYAFCANSPISHSDPTGMFLLENIKEGGTYGVVCVYPNYCLREESSLPEGEEIILHDYQTASNNSLPIILVDNIEDFADALGELEGMGVKTQDFVINSHGKSGSFSIGTEQVDISTDFTSLRTGLQNKNVLINACNVGLKPRGPKFTESFSDDTKSNTITSLQILYANYKYDNSNYLTNGLNFTPCFTSKFYLSEKGSFVKYVSNLTVDKYWGIRY